MDLELKRMRKAMNVIVGLIRGRIAEVENGIELGYIEEMNLTKEYMKVYVYRTLMLEDYITVNNQTVNVRDFRFMGEEQLKSIIEGMVNLEKKLK